MLKKKLKSVWYKSSPCLATKPEAWVTGLGFVFNPVPLPCDSCAHRSFFVSGAKTKALIFTACDNVLIHAELNASAGIDVKKCDQGSCTYHTSRERLRILFPPTPPLVSPLSLRKVTPSSVRPGCLHQSHILCSCCSSTFSIKLVSWDIYYLKVNM